MGHSLKILGRTSSINVRKVVWTLQHLGLPFVRTDAGMAFGIVDTPAYRALNPNGLIPVLLDGDLVVYETAAIAMHLADTHPQAGLMPPLGTPDRAVAYQWLAWLTNALQATLLVYYYPERWVAEGNAAAAAEVQARAEARIGGLLDQLDAECARRGGPWFLGGQVSVLPVAALHLLLSRVAELPADGVASKLVLTVLAVHLTGRGVARALRARRVLG